jgi:hypothetical protein
VAKKRRREKSISEYDVEGGKAHRAKRERPHVAQEYYEKGDISSAYDLTKDLGYDARNRALGGTRDHRRGPGWGGQDYSGKQTS